MGGDEEGRAVRMALLAHQVQHLVGGVRIQAGGGLVGDHQRRPLDQRAGNGHALALAAGQRVRPVFRMLMQADGAHSPGPDAEVVPWLIKERDVHGFGTESVGTDAGQAQHLDPPYPCHYYMHGNNRYGLQCLTNLDQLPATGAVIFSAPLKIRSGSGSPLRVLALAPTA